MNQRHLEILSFLHTRNRETSVGSIEQHFNMLRSKVEVVLEELHLRGEIDVKRLTSGKIRAGTINSAGVQAFIANVMENPSRNKTQSIHYHNHFGDGTTVNGVQQGSYNQQTLNVKQSPDLKPVIEFIQSLKINLKELNLETQVQREVEADIQTVEVQLQSDNPKLEKIRSSLHSIIGLTKGVVEKLTVTELATHLDKLLPFLHP